MYVGANGHVGLQAAVQEARSCTGLNIISYHNPVSHPLILLNYDPNTRQHIITQ